MNRKFKLIKTYPNFETLGLEIHTFSHYQYRCIQNSRTINKADVENNPEYWEEIIEIPEYMLCTRWAGNMYTAGKIYKVVNGCISDNDGETHPSVKTDFGSSFIPSTKEAFDLQNKPKFEVGKWYYFEAYYSKIPNIAKCDELHNDTFSTKEWVMINNRIKYISTGLWYYNQMRNIKELSIKDIQQYLPDYHPDKKVRELQVGDWLYVIAGNKINSKYNGDLLQITTIRDEDKDANRWICHTNNSFSGGGFRWENGGKYTGYIYGKDFRLATPEEIAKVIKPAEILYIGTPEKAVEISDKITAEGQTVSIKTLEDIYEDMIRNPFDDCPWRVTFPQVKIGCSTFTYSEIKQVINAYYEYNK